MPKILSEMPSIFPAFFFTLVSIVCAELEAEKPNIVFVMADDLGWNDVGFHGSEIKTPVIDSLAAEGVILDQYYVQPTCSPTRSQLMSGRYQIHTGLQHDVVRPSQPNGLPLNIPILPELLKEQGYSTHIIGKWHLGFYKKEYTPTYRGFDSHFGLWLGAGDYFSHTRCFSGNGNPACGLDFRDNMDPATTYSDKYSTHVFAEKAKEIISHHAASQPDQPLFLYLPFQAVHGPLQVPDHYKKPYEHIENTNRRTYAGMVSCLDEAIGNITQTLRQHGMWENTLFVFSTDNGGQVNAGGNNWPLRGMKTTLWEGGMRGVGFVHGKGVQNTKGTKVKELIHVSDWLPTLVTLAGGDVSALKLDGVNAWPSISEGRQSSRTELLHNIDPLSRPYGSRRKGSPFDNRIRAALRFGRWKLITGKPGPDGYYPPPVTKDIFQSTSTTSQKPRGVNKKNIWLYDILSDPLETSDLSYDMPDVVMGLLQRLADYNSTAVPCNYPPNDPNSNPNLHGGIWSTWVDSI